MICFRCGAPHSSVVYVRFNEKYGKTERRRECEGCGFRFTTHEEIRLDKDKRSNDMKDNANDVIG